jgi:type VI secretion system secreted protein VgrG
MPLLELSFASGEDSLSVRHFSVHEGISSLFSVSVQALSPHQDLDLESIVGLPASLRVQTGMKFESLEGPRCWAGVVSSIEQVQAEATGLSTYQLRIVPALWLLTQRRNYRVFQHASIPDIADEILGAWSLAPVWRIDRPAYPKLEYKVQYGESDYAFVTRLLEEAGIAFILTHDEGGGAGLVLSSEPQRSPPREGSALHYVDNPNQASEKEFVTHVRIGREVRPGAHTIRDHDFRKPGFPLFAEAPRAKPPEELYEQYHYRPGSFLVEGGKGGGTPVADDKGVARHEPAAGKARAERALVAERVGRRSVSFDTNAIDLAPGVVFSIARHPHADLEGGAGLLVTEFSIEGSPGGEWSMSAHAVFADDPYRPPARTPRPDVSGVQTATVVGPKGQEIHTDEFGRVRVQFPWDREGKNDDGSSCWVRVSQGWAGTGFGLITIPRVGQEVLMGFLEGDPDQPIVVGRVFNQSQQVPYKLPEHKTRSTWKSDTSPGSNGFNEIMFEDLAGKELVYVQAQKNLRKLVKNDETITVGNNRRKLVKNDETETVGGNRTEVTRGSRTEITKGKRTTIIGGDKIELVKGSDTGRTEGDLLLRVGGDQHVIVKAGKMELVEGDSHLRIQGDHKEQVDKTTSLTLGGLQVKVGKSHALETGKEIHFKAGSALVFEAADELTLKGPGGFICIDSGGVTIKGTLVKINSGGSAGSGSGASPEKPEKPKDIDVDEPEAPEPDDVGKTGLAQ